MHIDFCLADRGGGCLVAGWSPNPDLKLSLMVGARRVAPIAVNRFPRRDLGTRQDHGVMAAFRLREVSFFGDDPPEIALIVDGEVRDLSADRLQQDEARLITSGVDELFAAYLRALAAGLRRRPRRDVTRAILSRIQANLRALPAETPGMAVNLDRLLVSPSGLGVFMGWCLTDRAHPNPLTALVSGGRTLNPARIVPNSIRREDLAVYRDRYRYTGTDGFCGAFRLPTTPDRDGRMVLLSNVPHSDFVFGREAESVSDEEAAVALSELRASLADPRAAEALTAAAAPRLSQDAFEAPRPDDLDGADVTFALEVDVGPIELRDVLRLLHVALGRSYAVHLLGRQGGELTRPIAAAAAEARGDIVVGEPLTSSQLLGHDFGAVWVVYGRASTFFQMPLPSLDDAGRARVTYHDPLGSLPGSPDRAGWPGRANPPFLLAVPAPLLAAGFKAIPRGFMSPDGVMRAVIDLLHEHGLVAAEAAGGPTWFPGTEMQSHPEYGIARALDSEMRILVGQEERA